MPEPVYYSFKWFTDVGLFWDWPSLLQGESDKVAPIITISFCWDAREHPDPLGMQLNLVIDALEQERHKYARAC